ncbi:MAG: hypothetical protein ORN49_07190, partial [Rhodobacteraceae bacterium]|nr:hypothetical protein [Paracoccaceae bacterium]
MKAARENPQGRPLRLRTALWLAAALLAVFSVLILNGRPLFYYDTDGYVGQGRVALEQFGLTDPAASAARSEGSGAAADKIRTIDGSRSVFYSLLAGGAEAAGAIEILLLFNVALLLAAMWLLSGVLARSFGLDRHRPVLAFLPVIVACLGALPFYAAYLMPDLLT